MTMLQLFSDLHVDWAAPKVVMVDDRVDVVVVPGDVCEGATNAFVALRRIVPLRIPIVFVLGNHEYYRRFFWEELHAARSAAPDFNVLLLENDVAVIGGTRFVGATGWTDYRLFGDHNVPAVMRAARDGLNDHRRIGWRKIPWERFRPEEAAMLHARSRSFIAEVIRTPHDGPTVVVTHHAPSLAPVAERLRSEVLTAAYASTLAHDLVDTGVGHAGPRSLRPPVDFWFHGHVHGTADYVVGRTRVIVNAHGYGKENPAFDACLVLEIDG